MTLTVLDPRTGQNVVILVPNHPLSSSRSQPHPPLKHR
jgi:hypothetical protein